MSDKDLGGIFWKRIKVLSGLSARIRKQSGPFTVEAPKRTGSVSGCHLRGTQHSLPSKASVAVRIWRQLGRRSRLSVMRAAYRVALRPSPFALRSSLFALRPSLIALGLWRFTFRKPPREAGRLRDERGYCTVRLVVPVTVTPFCVKAAEITVVPADAVLAMPLAELMVATLGTDEDQFT